MASRRMLLTITRYHNYAQYLANWTDTPKPVSTNLQHRPLPVGTLYDNTTVQGSWINVQDMTENSNIFKRMVNNVSMAMPHAGVFAAATNPRNRILQPQDRDVSCIHPTNHSILTVPSGSWRVQPRSFGAITYGQRVVCCYVSGRTYAHDSIQMASL